MAGAIGICDRKSASGEAQKTVVCGGPQLTGVTQFKMSSRVFRSFRSFRKRVKLPEALLSAATVNIKKSAGRPESTAEDLRSYADRDGDLIKRQVELIAPDIVICGGTWDYVKRLWPAARPAYDHQVWRINSIDFIDFWHPANRWPDSLLYYALGWLIQNGIRPKAGPL